MSAPDTYKVVSTLMPIGYQVKVLTEGGKWVNASEVLHTREEAYDLFRRLTVGQK